MALFLFLVFIYLAFVATKGFYRLFKHPLSNVPGPKLAALTTWYEAYFELAHKGLGGQYTFHIQELHKSYGPIVRIGPNNVHIDDPNFYYTIYTYKNGFDKPDRLKWRFGAPSALFSIPDHETHRMRRVAQNPFFSKRRIARLSPMIQQKADKMCSRLIHGFLGKKRSVTLDNLFASYAADVTSNYSFNREFNWLDHENFEAPLLNVIRSFKSLAHPSSQFPWIVRLFTLMMNSPLRHFSSAVSEVMEFQEDMRNLVRYAKEELRDVTDDKELSIKADTTIIHGILTAGLPETELEVELLKDHAVSLIAAGTASPQWTLTTAFFHILSDNRVLKKLKHELQMAMPNPSLPLPLDALQQLPYLMACIEEALRLACGQMTRSPRLLHIPVSYQEHILPPQTQISLDTWHMHHNEVLYPDSYSFKPERWLNSPKAPPPYDYRPLKSYMVAFSRGTRHCIGLNLAHAEVTIAIATLIRRLDLVLFETDYEDVRVVRDQVAPDRSSRSKGVRALVVNQAI